MGHKISKEQIDPGVKDHIMSFVGDVADLETEVNTDIISAVNSLMVDRVDNAENMGKLANAIGEPVTANHSVDEVVEGLGEMLSTFKANMMNSGVMVESSDKFKQLIDKIKGLTEGEGNKGIQYAEGTVTVDSPFVITSSNPYTVSTNLDFIPSLIVVSFKSICSCSNITIDSIRATPNNKLCLNLGLQTYDYFYSSYLWLSDVTAESFKIYGSTEYSYGIGSGDPTLIQSSPFTWYAIGVGEEDTTLRDSLASILEEEGVSVTEEDDMASLISKVDSEFAKDNNTINDLNSQVNELEEDIENTRNTLAGLMTEGGYDITGNESIDNLLDLLVISGISVSDIKQIACGYGFAYIVKNDGTLYACGVNDRGQLGMGDINRRDTFTQITNTNINSNIKQVACGYAHAIILKNDGTLWATGNNTCAELGLGNTSEYIYNPVQITTNVSDVKEIFCGGCSYSNSTNTTIWDTTFMLKNDGTLWACGYNKVGQLGISNPLGNINKFTQVSTNVSDVKEIFSGGISTFMLKNDGTLWATGDNSCGQLGLGNTTQKTTFTKVNVTDVKQVAFLMSNDYYQNISQYGVYMLKNDGTLWACGYNTNYYLGLNDSTDKKTFTQVTKNINNDIKNIYANRHQVVALTNNNELYVKGQYAGLSQNDWNMSYDKFTKVTTNVNNDVLKVNCGGTFTIVLKHDSTLWATGGFCLSTTSDNFEFGKCARGV